MRSSRGSWSRWQSRLQSRRSLPVIAAVVLVTLILFFGLRGNSESVAEPGFVGKATRETKKETVKPNSEPTPAVNAVGPDRKDDAPQDGHHGAAAAAAAAAVESTTTTTTTVTTSTSSSSASSVSSTQKFKPLKGLVADKEKQDAVRAELKYSWDMYKKHAWGQDILCPLSMRGRKWVGSGIQIIDALDTLFIADLKQEYEDGVKWIETSLDFSRELNDHLPLFEATIRVLGGLLGANAIDPRPVFVQKAKEIGDALFWAISAAPGPFAHPTSVWRSKAGSGPQIVFAEVATLQMEFTYLSALTGDQKYADGVLKAFRKLYNTGNGLFGEQCSVSNSECHGKLSVGGGSDSGYEYFAKMYVMSGKKVPQFLEMWHRTVRDLKPMYKSSSPSQLRYFGDSWGGGNADSNWGHLQCFIGGTYALMAEYAPSEKDSEEQLEVGAQIARTCHEMYARTATGLGAAGLSMSGSKDFIIQNPDYVLRPEAIESWFYMYRYTKDQKYRDWAWEAFLALKKNCRIEGGGYAGLKDVNRVGSHEDTQETFLLAETFKYLYCIFSDETKCDLTKFMLNTEAHFTPILDPTANASYANLYHVMTDK